MELRYKYYIDIVISKEGFELDSKSLRDIKNIIKKIQQINRITVFEGQYKNTCF